MKFGPPTKVKAKSTRPRRFPWNRRGTKSSSARLQRLRERIKALKVKVRIVFFKRARKMFLSEREKHFYLLLMAQYLFTEKQVAQAAWS